MKRLLIVVLCCFVGSTDAGLGKATKFGSGAKVSSFSWGQLVLAGHSTGTILSEKDSDGYFFKMKETGKFVEVSADCVFEYE